mgnify:CR=1 FL=1|jgi:hypothetical protein
MGKILNIHPLELKPGVDIKEFEKFVIEEFSLFVTGKGNSFRVLKGIKGKDKDQYILVFDQTRDFYFASDEEQAERGRQSAKDNPENSKIFEKYRTFVANASHHEDDRYTHFNELD